MFGPYQDISVLLFYIFSLFFLSSSAPLPALSLSKSVLLWGEEDFQTAFPFIKSKSYVNPIKPPQS